MCTRTINIWPMLLNKWKKSLGGLTFLPPQSSIIKVRTSVWSQKMHKSVKITKNIWYVAICPVKQQFLTNTSVNMKKITKWGTLSALDGSLVNLLISDKAQKMAQNVPLTNIYNMSTNNLTPNKYFTNTVGELNNRKENHWGVDVSPSTEVCN